MERGGVTTTIKPSEGTGLLFDRSGLEGLPYTGHRDLQERHPRQAPASRGREHGGTLLHRLLVVLHSGMEAR